ncbi:hypothetical protein [Prosthecobacter fusiformis]|uniref:hypothetical protein n=1 Tax=Prosthecobacter fusiformis TaxID=48464 RepID=UPI00105FA01D|nr:hypothetical protein [Prosthecobacter fusiformis]
MFDPIHYLSEKSQSVFALERSVYRPQQQMTFGELGLGLMLWEGEFEGVTHQWLRWCDREGKMLFTGQERADLLAAKLREMGVDPGDLG